MYSEKHRKIAEKKTIAKKSCPNIKTSLKISISPLISVLGSPSRIVKTIKSQSNIVLFKKPALQTPKPTMPSLASKISIKSVEKKLNFSNNEDEPSPITLQHNRGFSMTEEEFKELRSILSNLIK